MNQLGLRIRDTDDGLDGDTTSTGDVISIDRLLGMVRRQRWMLVGCTILGMMIGLVYIATTPKTYYASSRVLIDDRLNKIVDEVAATSSILRDDTALSNQIEVLRSQQIARAVVDQLSLHENMSFRSPPVSLAESISNSISDTVSAGMEKVEAGVQAVLGTTPEPLPTVETPAPAPVVAGEETPALPSDPSDEAFPAPAPPAPGVTPRAPDFLDREPRVTAPEVYDPDAELKNRLANWLQFLVEIGRIGRSQVIEIGFESHDPVLAANLANAYADAYLADQLNASFDATQRTTDWLQNRLAELYASSQAAALEVEAFRRANGLSATDGRLITEQKLAQLNNQLAAAEADAARAEALMDEYRAIVEVGEAGLVDFATVSPNLTNDERLAEMQARLVTVSSRLAIIEQDFGADHPQAALLREEQEEISRTIFNAFSRLLQQVRGEYQIAKGRVEALRASVEAATAENSTASESGVKLRELQQRADTLAGLYETFLERYEQIDQRSSFPVSNVRVLSVADVPREPIAPSAGRVLIVGLVLGCLLGAMIGMYREWRERFFRTGDQVQSFTGLRFLGYLPRQGESKVSGFSLAGFFQGRKEAEKRKRVARARPLFVSIQEPHSIFAETLRNVRIACDVTLEGHACKVLGVTSALAGEGKSTVSSNLANLLAMSGHKTLLVDADMRNPGLTSALGIDRGDGIIEVAVGDATWTNAVRTIGVSKLHIVPCIKREQLSHSSELLQSAAMAEFLEEAKARYDYVIFDLPPVGAVVDAKAMAPKLHKLVFVAEWGRTPRALVRQLLNREPLIRSKVVGLVLNKVEMKGLPQFSAPDESDAYIKSYTSYHKGTA